MDDDLLISEVPAAPAEQPSPVCPYCALDPALAAVRGPIRIGVLLVQVIYCGNPECRKIWSVAVVGSIEEKPKIIGVQPPSEGPFSPPFRKRQSA